MYHRRARPQPEAAEGPFAHGPLEDTASTYFEVKDETPAETPASEAAEGPFAHGPLEAPTPADGGRRVWWVDLGSWVRIDNETQELIEAARLQGQTEVQFRTRGHPYLIDLTSMTLINMNTLKQRDIKGTEEDESSESSEDDECDEEPEDPIEPDTVLLDRLPPNIEEEGIQAALKHVGTIERVHLAREAGEGSPCKGFGWVTFSSREEAEAACDLSELLECGGRMITICISELKWMSKKEKGMVALSTSLRNKMPQDSHFRAACTEAIHEEARKKRTVEATCKFYATFMSLDDMKIEDLTQRLAASERRNDRLQGQAQLAQLERDQLERTWQAEVDELNDQLRKAQRRAQQLEQQVTTLDGLYSGYGYNQMGCNQMGQMGYNQMACNQMGCGQDSQWQGNQWQGQMGQMGQAAWGQDGYGNYGASSYGNDYNNRYYNNFRQAQNAYSGCGGSCQQAARGSA